MWWKRILPARTGATVLILLTAGGLVREAALHAATGNAAAASAALVFSTYLGGSNVTRATAAATDRQGNIYIAGLTSAPDLPVKSAAQPVFGGGTDAFVAKFDATGGLVYCTYLGGNDYDVALAIAVDASGSAFVAGETYSRNFPTAGYPAQSSPGGAADAFLVKLGPTGNQLLYSTYLGGTGVDLAQAVAVDSAGAVYVAGQTASTNFPRLNALQTSLRGTQNAFVAKYGSAGQLLFSTYLGGAGTDAAMAIAVDGAGALYVAGATASFDFPVAGALQTDLNGSQDAFITKLSPSGRSIVYSTYLGGRGGNPEMALSIDVDSEGSAYVAGTTGSTDLPVRNAFQGTIGGTPPNVQDGFLAKLNPDGASLSFATYLGGRNADSAVAVRVDAYGACVAGYTASADFPLTRSPQATVAGLYDAFVACFGASGKSLGLGAVLGGALSDAAGGLAIDGTFAYLAGVTASTDFPLLNAAQTRLNSGQAAFVAKLSGYREPLPAAPVAVSPANGAADTSLTPTLQWNPSDGAVSYDVYFGTSSPPPLAGSTTGTAFSPTGLSGNTTYHWMVSAANTTGSASSPVWSFTTACTYSVSLGGGTVSASGGAGSLALTAPAGCAWSASSDQPWLTITSATVGTGAATIAYSAAANPTGSSRSAQIAVAGQTFTVVQSGPPLLTIAKTHPGNFTQGQAGATHTVTVGNASATAPTTGSVTVTETVPTGLTLVSMAGTGWTCLAGGTTCTRGDALAAGASYPPITVTVNVAANAPAQVTNQATVSGGGSAAATASDLTTIAASAPSVVSATAPASGSSLFVFRYADTGSHQSLGWVHALIHSSLNGAGACWIQYSRPANRIYLANDTGTQALGGLAPGAAGTLQNSQCSIDLAASSAAGSGNNLTLTVAITFPTAFYGLRNFYLAAQDVNGPSTGWQQMGSLALGGGTPSVVSFSGLGGGAYAFTYGDTGAYQSLTWVHVLIQGSFSAAGACWVSYSLTANQLFLVNDAGTQLLGPVSPGGAGTLQNSQCSIGAAGSSASGSGNNLTLTMPIVFSAGFVGTKNVYMAAQDIGGASSGWQQKSALALGGGTPSAAFFATPSAGLYAFTYADTGGYQSLAWTHTLIQDSLSSASACWVVYSQTANQLFLVDDTGSQMLGPAAPGTAGTLQNGQCSVNAGASSVSGSGNNLTVTLAITFQAAFTGTKNAYLSAQDITGSSSGWQQKGSLWLGSGTRWTSSFSVPGTGTYTFTYGDTAGYRSLGWTHVLIQNSLTGAGACWVAYSQTTNQLFLLNDAGSQLLGPLTPGVVGTMQNGQCSLNGAASSVSGAGNNLTLSLALTFQAAFAGKKNVYMAVQDTAGASSGWQLKGGVSLGGGQPSAVSFGRPGTNTYTFTYADSAGYQSLGWAQALIQTSLSAENACWVAYSQSANQLFLINDSGTQLQGGLTPGAAGTTQNSQCSLNAAASSVSGAGNTLTLSLSLTFQPSFSGTKSIYLSAQDVTAASSGWQQLGSVSLGGGMPSAVSFAAQGGGTYAFTYGDTGGYQSLSWVYALVQGSLTAANACWIAYSQSSNQLFLTNNAGTVLQGGLTPGAAGTLQNGQCSLNAAASSVSGSGNNLTMTLAITFQTGFAGTKNVYLSAQDVIGTNSGWQQKGSLILGGGTPSVVSFSAPVPGTYAFTYSDTGGYQSLGWTHALIQSSLTATNGCWVAWSQSANQLFLINDAGTQALGGLTPGAAGTVQNSQCSLNAAASSVTASGNNLTVTVAITFQGAFAGTKNFYLSSQDITGASSGWQLAGSRALP